MIQRLKSKITIQNVLISLLLAIEFWIVIDILLTFTFGLSISIFFFPIGFVILLTLLLLLPFKRYRPRIIISIVLPLILVLSALFPYLVYTSFRSDSGYESIPCSSTEFFSNKKVMIIVPHEDDDLNLTSGMIENYIDCGSEIYPVFVTNGDHFGLGEERINEAIQCWNYLGVPESNVFFLGYGDGWNAQGAHIYNAKDNEPMTSYIGKTETYGTATHPAYHNENLYTNKNYQNDLKGLILEIKPDVLFISDYDAHSDHMAVSLLSETVIGEILKTTDGYQPIVYKGFAYSTAWKAPDDFYSLNSVSSQEPSELIGYDWKDRVRIPVSTRSLSRSAFTTSVYCELSRYGTQNAVTHTARIVNSDKVFWQRRTDSLLYHSEIETSSGNSSLLNDFKILDSFDVNDLNHNPYDGVWIPDDNDSKKAIHITLKQKTDIAQIVLYDNPSPDDNITNARISFADGTTIETGKLNNNGCATVVDINKKNVETFTITLQSAKGEQLGLAEIEAFESPQQTTDEFIKLMDGNQNFLYDYITEKDEVYLSLYSNLRDNVNISEVDYSITCDNDKIVCEFVDNQVFINCPKSEHGLVTLAEKETGLSDTVKVCNPGTLERMKYCFGQYIESEYVFPANEKGNRNEQNIYEIAINNFTVYRFFSRVKAFVF